MSLDFDDALGRRFVETAKRRGDACHRRFDGPNADLRPHARRRTALVTLGSAHDSRRNAHRPASARIGRRRACKHRHDARGKIPVNLNFTAGSEAVAYAIHQCGITTILTSRAFLTKAQLEPLDGMVFLEDVMRGIGRPARCGCWPSRACCRRTRSCAAFSTRTSRTVRSRRSSSRAAARACPKGVMLTHRNILANIDAVGQVFDVIRERPDRRRAAVLPFVRLHRHAVVSARRRRSARLSPEPDRREDDRRARREIPGHDPLQHADVL